MFDIKLGIKGHYILEIQRGNADGTFQPKEVVAEFDNLITNNGMDAIYNSNVGLNWCHVGSGSTPPAFSDTALVSKVAAQVQTGQTDSGVNTTGDPIYYRQFNVTYQFAQGAAAGNLTEVGTAGSATANLFSRALILDTNGQPTTVVVTSIDILTVTYQIRVSWDTSDFSTTLTVAGVNYPVTLRPLEAANTGYWFAVIIGAGTYATNSGWYECDSYTGQTLLAKNNSRGGPGSLINTNNAVAPLGGYVTGSFSKVYQCNWTITQANNFGFIWWCNYGFGCWQLAFTSTKLPKDNTMTMHFEWTVSWVRG